MTRPDTEQVRPLLPGADDGPCGWGRAHPWVRPKGQDSCACECFDRCAAGFWPAGVLSQSPHFRSYSNLVTSLMPRKGAPHPFLRVTPFQSPPTPTFLPLKWFLSRSSASSFGAPGCTSPLFWLHRFPSSGTIYASSVYLATGGPLGDHAYRGWPGTIYGPLPPCCPEAGLGFLGLLPGW